MIENKPEREELLSGFELFLKKNLKVGDQKAIYDWMSSENRRILGEKYPFDFASSYSDSDMREIFNLIGESYGTQTNVYDQKKILSELLDNGVRDVRTLSVGCGLAPHEIYLASQGIVNEEIVGVDFAHSFFSRGKEIAGEEGVGNIRFEEKAASDISYDEEFGQAWMIDSLHWMQSWKDCLKKTCSSLRKDGSLFLVYSIYSPRVRIDVPDVVSTLAEEKLDVKKLNFLESKAESPRALIYAKKETSTGELVVVRSV